MGENRESWKLFSCCQQPDTYSMTSLTTFNSEPGGSKEKMVEVSQDFASFRTNTVPLFTLLARAKLQVSYALESSKRFSMRLPACVSEPGRELLKQSAKAPLKTSLLAVRVSPLVTPASHAAVAVKTAELAAPKAEGALPSLPKADRRSSNLEAPSAGNMPAPVKIPPMSSMQAEKGTQTPDPEPAVQAGGQQSLPSPPDQTQKEPSSQAMPARKKTTYAEAEAQTSYVKIPLGNKWRVYRLCAEAQVQTSCQRLPVPHSQTALQRDAELA